MQGRRREDSVDDRVERNNRTLAKQNGSERVSERRSGRTFRREAATRDAIFCPVMVTIGVPDQRMSQPVVWALHCGVSRNRSARFPRRMCSSFGATSEKWSWSSRMPLFRASARIFSSPSGGNRSSQSIEFGTLGGRGCGGWIHWLVRWGWRRMRCRHSGHARKPGQAASGWGVRVKREERRERVVAVGTQTTSRQRTRVLRPAPPRKRPSQHFKATLQNCPASIRPALTQLTGSVFFFSNRRMTFGSYRSFFLGRKLTLFRIEHHTSKISGSIL